MNKTREFEIEEAYAQGYWRGQESVKNRSESINNDVKNWSEPIKSGKPIEIEAGKTYVVELERSMPFAQLDAIAKLWREQTGSKVIFLDGGKIARTGVDEAELREQIAKEIEALCCDPLKCNDYRANVVECVHTNAKWEKAASIARGMK